MKNKYVLFLLTIIIVFESVLLHININSLHKEINDISRKLDTLSPSQLTIIKEVPTQPSETPIIDEEINIQEKYSTEIPYLAKLVWGEARGCSKTQQAGVIWCVLNRVDDGRWPNDIIGVITQKTEYNGIIRKQFSGYDENNPVEDEFVELAIDVLTRWEREKNGETDVGRVLPKEYAYFYGDGKINHFTTAWKSTDEWNWSWGSVY